MQSFVHWLSQLLKQSELEVQRLLADETAMYFLLAWSLFESKCFHSDLKATKLPSFAEELANDNGLTLDSLCAPARHFHVRYQDRKKLNNLMPKDKTPNWVVTAFKDLLSVPYDDLSKEQVIKLVAFVIYRFRNNMFHGAKGIRSWLQYREEIQLCVDALQVFVTYAESKYPTIGVQEAA